MALNIAYYKKLNAEFHDRVGTIDYYEDVEALGLHPRNALGAFKGIDGDFLLRFCENNPDYHIVTRLSAFHTVNRFVRGDFIYNLALGDSDQSLERIYPPEIVDHLMSELELFIKRIKPESCF